jgi:hypothetical protein
MSSLTQRAAVEAIAENESFDHYEQIVLYPPFSTNFFSVLFVQIW